MNPKTALRFHEPDGAPLVVGTVDTPAGPVPKVSTALKWTDRLGHWRARWGVGRMQSCVKPRLYAVGNPTGDSPVFVGANYKMSFDRLRAELAGLDAWILVLDTKGINVWCAAGKGTFGTDELIRQINSTHLPEIVSRKRVIVPQLPTSGSEGFLDRVGPVRDCRCMELANRFRMVHSFGNDSLGAGDSWNRQLHGDEVYGIDDLHFAFWRSSGNASCSSAPGHSESAWHRAVGHQPLHLRMLSRK